MPESDCPDPATDLVRRAVRDYESILTGYVCNLTSDTGDGTGCGPGNLHQTLCAGPGPAGWPASRRGFLRCAATAPLISCAAAAVSSAWKTHPWISSPIPIHPGPPRGGRGRNRLRAADLPPPSGQSGGGAPAQISGGSFLSGNRRHHRSESQQCGFPDPYRSETLAHPARP